MLYKVSYLSKMKGRSKITFKEETRNIPKGIDEEEENADLVTRAEWLRKVAEEHTAMGNKLINIARRMKIKARRNGSSDGTEENPMLMGKTWIHAIKSASSSARRSSYLISKSSR